VQTLKQLKWDESYLQIAEIISGFSYDPKYKVGAIVVNNDTGAIVGLGYNGRGKGRPNERFSNETGQSGFVHAEMNAIARVSWETKCTYTLYTTLSPCLVCAALILNNPIVRVVYRQAYKDGLEGLNEITAGLGKDNVVLHAQQEVEQPKPQRQENSCCCGKTTSEVGPTCGVY
jgi:dCMP deaminase